MSSTDMSAWWPTASEPMRSSWPSALAGLMVHISTTCSRVNSMARKRVIISVMLWTVNWRPGRVRSVLMQWGINPWSSTRWPTSKLKFIRPWAVSSHTPRSWASLASGTSLPWESITPPGLAVKRWVTMSPSSRMGSSWWITFSS